jgi:hypothetical protein
MNFLIYSKTANTIEDASYKEVLETFSDSPLYPCFVYRTLKKKFPSQLGPPSVSVGRDRRIPAVRWPWSAGDKRRVVEGLPRGCWWPELGRKHRCWERSVVQVGGGHCDQVSGEARRNAGQHTVNLASVGSSRALGKAKRLKGREGTGAHPGGVHGGSAELVGMARRGGTRGRFDDLT